jgi:hypothetical protein
VCFWWFVLRIVRVLSLDNTDFQVADRPTLWADRPPVLKLCGQCSSIVCCQDLDHPTGVGGVFRPDFSNSSNRIRKGNLVVTCMTNRRAIGRGPSSYARKEGNLLITDIISWRGKNRSGAPV